MSADSSAVRICVSDAFGVASDPGMPFLKSALDPILAAKQIRACWTKAKGTEAELRAIRVQRYKPGRRCLVEYEIRIQQGGTASSVVVLGKARAKGTDTKTFELQRALWRSGFNADSADGILVPEVIDVVPEFGMWLQIKVAGLPATNFLADTAGVALARRIAEAAHKLHGSNIPAARQHTIGDELRILHDRLSRVIAANPKWQGRLERLFDACNQLARRLPEYKACVIHRDFYPAQVIVDGSRVCLTDFDLYCEGDPALDIGNFLGHMTEQSLRSFGNSEALREQEIAMEERFVELTGEATRQAVRSYATLTLARHVFISTLFPERRPFTARILDLCEERLASV